MIGRCRRAEFGFVEASVKLLNAAASVAHKLFAALNPSGHTVRVYFSAVGNARALAAGHDFHGWIGPSLLRTGIDNLNDSSAARNNLASLTHTNLGGITAATTGDEVRGATARQQH
jgi:hypothetical protein